MAISPILQSLGFGGGLGDQLSDQVADETEEERRRRLGLLQQRQRLGTGSTLSPIMNALSGSVLGAYGR
jgi:hypothetical protein